jgi:hypothetical protein
MFFLSGESFFIFLNRIKMILFYGDAFFTLYIMELCSQLDKKLMDLKIMITIIFILLFMVGLIESYHSYSPSQSPLSKNKKMIIFYIQKNFIKYHRHTMDDMDSEWIDYHFRTLINHIPMKNSYYIRKYYNEGNTPEFKQIKKLLTQ